MLPFLRDFPSTAKNFGKPRVLFSSLAARSARNFCVGVCAAVSRGGKSQARGRALSRIDPCTGKCYARRILRSFCDGSGGERHADGVASARSLGVVPVALGRCDCATCPELAAGRCSAQSAPGETRRVLSATGAPRESTGHRCAAGVGAAAEGGLRQHGDRSRHANAANAHAAPGSSQLRRRRAREVRVDSDAERDLGHNRRDLSSSQRAARGLGGDSGGGPRDSLRSSAALSAHLGSTAASARVSGVSATRGLRAARGAFVLPQRSAAASRRPTRSGRPFLRGKRCDQGISQCRARFSLIRASPPLASPPCRRNVRSLFTRFNQSSSIVGHGAAELTQGAI
jgi:hypothetical protein